ncbi:MAG: ABC transporter ATP-binding protein, partial [Bacillota bacterium]|nr:ABC transporter ATP-binding protein [Bacillota bacterium]
VDKGIPREAFSSKELYALYGPSGKRSGHQVETMSNERVTHPVIESKNSSRPVLEWKQTNFSTRLQLNKAVKAGEFIGVVGPSGSGKTTLLESAIGLIMPTEGQILGFGAPITKVTLNDWRKEVRLVLQEAGEYLIGRTAYQEVYFGEAKRELENNRSSRLSYLGKFGLVGNLLDYAPEQLSGGERQRVALAAALRTNPEILLMDEPLLGLDLASRRRIQTMISELKDITIMYVTHDLRDVLQDADRLWLVEGGKVVLDCSKQCWKEHLEQFRAAGVRF